MKKRLNKLWVCAAFLLAALTCLSCVPREDPYRVDTVLRIPADPTEQTAAVTLAPTEPEGTVPETTQATEPAQGTEPARNPSGGKTASGKPSGGSVIPAQTQAPTQAPTEAPTEPAPEPAYDPWSYVTGNREYEFLALVNEQRRQTGVPELAMDEWLCALASLRAWEASRLWSHTRPDGRGWESVLSDYGYNCSLRTEHLVFAPDYLDGRTVAGDWLETEEKRASLLDPGYATAGIGIYEENGYTYLVCLLVG